MPLRPVSELGLVDLTDLAARDETETATPHAQAGANPKPKPRTSSRTKGAEGQAGSRSRPKSARPTTTKRSPHQGKAAGKVGSAAKRRTATAHIEMRQEPADRGGTPGVPASVMKKIGVPLLGGLATVAGGLLVARSALQR